MANSNKKKGRGWHGNSAGHAAAGRKGGKQRGKNARAKIGMNMMA